MKNRMRSFLFFIALTMSCSGFGQNLIGTAGGTANSSSAVLSWSVGEAIIGTSTGTRNAITAGYQQPSPLVITSTFEDPESQFNVFPNPARDKVFVDRPNVDSEVRVVLYDVNGKNLQEEQFNVGEKDLEIVAEHLTAGVYILRGFSKDRLVFERKVVKL